MNSRIRLLITLAFVCHLLVAPRLVTSQLLSPSDRSAISQIPPNFPSTETPEQVTIRALEQEKDGVIYKLNGKVEIVYGANTLRADHVTYNSDTGEATAEGNLVFDGADNDEHIKASRGAYNLKNQTGRFENVEGTLGIQFRGKEIALSSPNPFRFTGKIVEKTAPNRYVVHDGTVTTCEIPRPKWQFNAKKVVVDVDGNAQIHHSSFRVEGIPVLYLPYATHPVHKQRQSGFLIPNIGHSSRKGTILGESVYWAINRSMDATLGTQYFSSRGWAPQGEFRARPTGKSYVDLGFLSVLDRGFGTPKVDQGGANVTLDAQGNFGHKFRAVANIDYLTSYVFRLAFNEVFTMAVNSEVKSQAFLSNTSNNFFLNASTRRYQNFESTANGDVITILHAPSFEASTVDRQIGHSPFYWSYEAAAGGLSRSEPSFRTANLVGRFDFHPSISMPLQLGGWAARPEISLRDTFYTQELMPSSGIGVAASDPINRRALEGSFELRPPAVERVFDHELFGRKWKHVIEPSATYRYVTGVNDFDHILRFDDRDILSNTNEVEYGLISRLYAKRTSGETDCGSTEPASLGLLGHASQSRVPWEDPSATIDIDCTSQPQSREVITWELKQKYFLDPTFGGALVPGRRNVLATTADLTGIAFLTDARRLSPLVSRLRIQTTSRSDVEWDLDYDIKKGRIAASTALLTYHLGQFTLGGGDAFLQVPGEQIDNPTPQQFNQFRLLLGYGAANKRGFSGAINAGYDARLNFLQYAAVQTSYNWSCCGISLEYRRFALGSVRNENQYRFTFALANIGAFGNLRRQERLF